MINLCKFLLFSSAALLLAACAQDEKASYVAQKIRTLYPKTRFQDIRPSDISGLYEIKMGDTVAYTDETGRYFVFGHLFDMQKQIDLTARRHSEDQKIDFPTKSLSNAIKEVKGNGQRTLIVFADPDCHYCKKLEIELSNIDNVTVYTFLYPLESIHPGAKTKSISVWCAADRLRAWQDLMLRGVQPQLKACVNPISENIVLASRLGIRGTPTLIAGDGRVLSGVASSKTIDLWLSKAGVAQAEK